MSLRDLGKNDVSEETQALKERLANKDTENAGLHTQLIRREAQLEELQATLNETVYKLSKEADRALHLEQEASARSSELKTERMSLRNTELALQSAQEKLKVEERARRELEGMLDTVSLHSQATTSEHQSVQREKRALESRLRELEHIVQTYEAKSVSNVSRKNGRPRSSSVTSFRLPVVEQELNETRAQLHAKDTNLRAVEQKLAQAHDDLMKAENARISIDKAGQIRISELLTILERKEEELDSLRSTDNAGEREDELLKRIDEDTAKIAALEKLVADTQAARTSQARIHQLQSQLRLECEKVHRSEDLRNRLHHEKEELATQCEAARREIEESHQLLEARERRITELESRQAHLLAEIEANDHPKDHTSSQLRRQTSIPGFPDESALADHIQTLLQAIDRLRGERDELKRALEFSEVEYRITADGFQSRITSLTRQLTATTRDVATEKPFTNILMEQRTKQMTTCAAAFAVVISNVQRQLDLAEDHLAVTSADLASSNSRLHDVLATIDIQNQLLDASTHEHDTVLHKLDALSKESSDLEKERDQLHLQLADLEARTTCAVESAKVSDAARDGIQERLLSVEQRLATLLKNYQDIESERNSLALQITNLRDDLARAQDELSDTRDRYNTLHAQQLTEMSASEVVQALKGRIQELEECLTRRSDQVSEYQHDIRRLEENGKLHEERLAEMTSELELLHSQKEAMVEDCAEAREARDEAIGRSEMAEEETERLQRQMQLATEAHKAELSTMSSTIASLTSENKQTSARLADLKAENVGFIQQIDSLNRDHQHLTEELTTAICRDAEMQQSIVSLAIVYHEYKEAARQLQKCSKHVTRMESQLVVLGQELGQRSAITDGMEKEKQVLLQRLSKVSSAIDIFQSDPTSCLRTEEFSDICTNTLQEVEQDLANVRQELEATESHSSGVEVELLERVAMMVTTQKRQAQETAALQAELGGVRTQLQSSMDNFADLEKLHDDVIQEFAAAKKVLELRLTETDAQIHSSDMDYQCSLATIEAKYRHEADILTNNLEDRENEVEELRQRLQETLEAHAHTEEKLEEALKSHEARHGLMSDLEKDLRRTITDTRQRLLQAEAGTIALQEERQSLQAQVTGLQAEIQRSTSLTRYLESQVRESDDACALLKENLQQAELSLAESEKAGKAAEFNLALQTTQHEKVIAALRREIVSLQSRPELHSALADLEERNREIDDLLKAKCQEIEEYDDRILETLKANKKLTSKVESLTRKTQALQAKLSSMKAQPQLEAMRPAFTIPVPASATMPVGGSTDTREHSAPSPSLGSKTPEPRLQSPVSLPPARTPSRMSEPPEGEVSAGKKRPAPDDDERDGVPAEGHYPTDVCLRNGPTPRLRRAHGHPTGFTPVRGAASRKAAGSGSPGRRPNVGTKPSEIITDVTNSPRAPPGQRDVQLKKRGWLGKVRSGAGGQSARGSRS